MITLFTILTMMNLVGDFSNDFPFENLLQENQDMHVISEEIVQEVGDLEELEVLEAPQPRMIIDLAIDAEFIIQENGLTIPVSVQGVFRHEFTNIKLMVVDQRYESKIDGCLVNEIGLKYDTKIYFEDFKNTDSPILLEYFYKYLETDNPAFYDLVNQQNSLSFNVYLYYSPKDLIYAFGYNNLYPYFTNKKQKIDQRRNLRGKFTLNYYGKNNYFYLKDLYGLEGGGLAKLAASVGLAKLDILNMYKHDMGEAFLLRTDDFVNYSMNDAELLFTIFERKIESFNNTLDILGVDESQFRFTKTNTPTTVGTVVYKIFRKYLQFAVFKDDVIYVACLKQGILNKVHKKYMDNLEYHSNLSNYSNLDELYDYRDNNKKEFKQMVNSLTAHRAFSYYVWQYASVNYLISESPSNTNTPILGLTTGGRTVNERPKEAVIDYGADIDIMSAYGSRLEKLVFPIGRPRILSYTSNQTDQMTLGELMNKFELEAKTGLYKVVVEGDLSFEQDLIFSKLKVDDFSRYKIVYDKVDPDDAAVDAPFVLLRKEIRNGFITKDMWEVLKKVCTNRELKEITNLKVVSAVYWLDADRASSIEVLANNYLEDKGGYYFCNTNNCFMDNRTYKWYGLELKNVVGSLIQRRKELKKKKDPVSMALQESIKLIVNTIWGLLTSPYFDINNVVCSEIVTSSIRTNVWLLNKALNTHMTISDGGPYSLMNVSYLQGTRLPGLSTFSSYYKYKKHRGVKLAPLANINWQELFEKQQNPMEGEFKNLDVYAQKHIETFWSAYDIKFDVSIEHKPKTFIRAAYIAKAHYLFKVFDEETQSYSAYYHKIRGFRLEAGIKFRNPIYDLLIHLIEKGPNVKFVLENEGLYYQKKILKLNAWRKSLMKVREHQKVITVSKYGSHIEPGDNIIF